MTTNEEAAKLIEMARRQGKLVMGHSGGVDAAGFTRVGGVRAIALDNCLAGQPAIAFQDQAGQWWAKSANESRVLSDRAAIFRKNEPNTGSAKSIKCLFLFSSFDTEGQNRTYWIGGDRAPVLIGSVPIFDNYYLQEEILYFPPYVPWHSGYEVSSFMEINKEQGIISGGSDAVAYGTEEVVVSGTLAEIRQIRFLNNTTRSSYFVYTITQDECQKYNAGNPESYTELSVWFDGQNDSSATPAYFRDYYSLRGESLPASGVVSVVPGRDFYIELRTQFYIYGETSETPYFNVHPRFSLNFKFETLPPIRTYVSASKASKNAFLLLDKSIKYFDLKTPVSDQVFYPPSMPTNSSDWRISAATHESIPSLSSGDQCVDSYRLAFKSNIQSKKVLTMLSDPDLFKSADGTADVLVSKISSNDSECKTISSKVVKSKVRSLGNPLAQILSVAPYET